MSTTYKLRKGDDVRDMEITLLENRKLLSATPTSAILKINVNGVIKTRVLTHKGGNVWAYRWLDADFVDIPVGTYSAEVYCTFVDNSNATFPTNGALTIIIQPIM